MILLWTAIVLFFLFLISTIVLIVSYQQVKLRFQFILARKLKKGLVRIVGHNYILQTYVKKFAPKMEVKNHVYTCNDRLVIMENKVPVLYFYEGDTKPINMLKIGESLEDPELLNEIILKAHAAGVQGAMKEQKYMLWASLAAAGAAAICCVLVFRSQTVLTEILRLVGGA